MGKNLSWTTAAVTLALGAAACKTTQETAATKDFVTKTTAGGVAIFYNHVESPDANPVKYVCMADCDAALGEALSKSTVGLLDAGQRYCGAAPSICVEKAKFYNLWFDPAIGLASVAGEAGKIDQILDKASTGTDPGVTDWVVRTNAAFARLADALRQRPTVPLALSAEEEQAIIKKLDPANSANVEKVRQQVLEEKERRLKAESDAAAAKAKAEAEAAAAKVKADADAAAAKASADAAADAAAEAARREAEAKAAAEAARVAAEERRALLQLVELQGTLPAVAEHASCKHAGDAQVGAVGARGNGGPQGGSLQLGDDDGACLVELLAGLTSAAVAPPDTSSNGARIECAAGDKPGCKVTVTAQPFYSLAGTIAYASEMQTAEARSLYYKLNIRAVSGVKAFCTAEQAAAGIPRACLTCLDTGDHAAFWCQALVRMPRTEYQSTGAAAP